MRKKKGRSVRDKKPVAKGRKLGKSDHKKRVPKRIQMGKEASQKREECRLFTRKQENGK